MFRFTEDGSMPIQCSLSLSAPKTGYDQDSTELLYIWIGKDDTCYIRQQGFNFSPSYQFEITDMGEDGYRLDWREKSNRFNMWNYQNIVNLTAIVGENGSGKTSLLRYLAVAPTMLNREGDDSLVQVYRIGNSIKIFCKLDKELRFDAERQCGDMKVSIAKWCGIGNLGCQQTRFLMSNAASDVFFSGSGEKHEPIIFTPKKDIARTAAFYRKVSSLKPDFPENFRKLQQKILSENSVRCFEEFSVVSYYSQVQSGWCLDTNNREFALGVVSPITWFRISDWVSVENGKSEGATFRALLAEYLRFLGKKPDKEICAALWDLLCFEVLTLVKDIEQILNDPEHFSELKKDPVQYLLDHMGVMHDGVIEYYRRAKKEITELDQILRKCSLEDRDYIERNNNAVKTVVLKRDSDQYRLFCEFVDKHMKEPASFVLKYLIVRMPPQSSGELAMQNMLSRLRMAPYFREILGEDSATIGNNMLLLLDEVDLYMHPEWQRQFLKLLSDGLQYEYPQKHIQVIITTHSPLVLSDIPSDNIVYLKRDGDKSRIVHGPDMEETFGANIFSLLKDSFFLSKSLGEFAHSRISKVIDDLEELKRYPDKCKLRKTCEDHLQLINRIGEPIIRRKLLMMYEDAIGSGHARLEKQSLERVVRLLESDDPKVRRNFQERLNRFLKENEPG